MRDLRDKQRGWNRWGALLSMIFASWLGVGLAHASPFVNLDFEQAVVPPGTQPGQQIPAAAAFPGWAASISDFQLSQVYYDDAPDAAFVSLWDKDSFLGVPLLQGRYYPLLGVDAFNQAARGVLTQTGDVPVGARSITLLASGSNGPPHTYLDGNEIPLISLTGPTFNNIERFGGDITAFAGTARTLRLETAGFQGADDIIFSSTAVPEPSALVVLLGLLMLFVNKLR